MIALIVLQGKLHHFIVRGVIAENSRPVGCGKLPAVVFYRSRELRVAPSRELLDASTGTDVVVLIIPPTADTLRTVKSSRFRSNSKVCHDRHSYRSRATARELPAVDTAPYEVARPAFLGGVFASARTVTIKGANRCFTLKTKSKA